MPVTPTDLIGVVLNLAPMALGGAPLAALELAAASALSRLITPADVEAAAAEVAHLALDLARLAAKHAPPADTGNAHDDAGQYAASTDTTGPTVSYVYVPLPEDDPARGGQG